MNISKFVVYRRNNNERLYILALRHYIKPYLEQCPELDYAMAMSLTNELNTVQRADFDRAMEFWASRAFMLGVRTGAGLRDTLV